MEVIFNTSGMLNNELGKVWENRDFRFATSISVEADILETELSRTYSIDGILPNKLSIDPQGVISGRLGLLDEQEVSLPTQAKKPIGIDGKNWQNDGSSKAPLHIFSFKMVVTIEYEKRVPIIDEGLSEDSLDIDNSNPDEDTTLEEIIIETKSFTSDELAIMIIKNNNMANTRFVKRYLEAGYPLKIDNDTYTLKNINGFLSRHPGPFEIL